MIRAGKAPWTFLLLLLAGCGHHVAGTPVENLRPTVSLSGAPAPLSDVTYQVRLRWTALDPDGEIRGFQYVVDPPLEADTMWTWITAREVTLTFPSTESPDPLPAPGQRITARDQHTFVLRAVDNQGLPSEPAIRSFTSRTIVPWSTIFRPRPSAVPASTLTQVTIEWRGVDIDGPDGLPVSYRYRLAPAELVSPQSPEFVSEAAAQQYFGAQAVEGFAGWDSTSRDTTRVVFERLDADRTYVFAVSACDDAGARESRFMTSSNVLVFTPTLDRPGPRMTVYNSYFRRTLSGGVSLAPSRVIPLEIPSGSNVTFFWFGEPSTGAQMGGYRWALDLEDLTDETPRRDDSDVRRWSAWSLEETSATIGPFAGTPGSDEIHRLYVMGRDDVGFPSLFTVELRVVAPTHDRELLVIDDRYGPLIATAIGPYPTEAEEDTFHFAVGGVPDRHTGGMSVPGAFAGLPYDTLDYRTRLYTPGQGAGIPLSLLDRYRVVAWFTDATSAAAGSGSDNNPPPTGLRHINVAGRLNTLAAYLRHGGKLLLFGEGAPIAIAGGYWSAFTRFPPTIPYTGSNVLRPGSFLHDYLHLRSTASTGGLTGQRLVGAVPHLPAFRGPATPADRSLDPRIGPGAERTAERWPDLPRLTMASHRTANPDPALRNILHGWHVASPLRVTEGGFPVVDTLYLFQAQVLDPTSGGSDGKPNALHYRGSEHGEVVWLGFPLYYFELEQARTLVHRALTVLGVPPQANARAGAGRVTASPGEGR